MKLQSGYPFSLIRYGLPYSYPKLQAAIKADVVIVGGGISGALTAYHLQKAGVECVVVDGRTIGLGSTCASTSFLQYEIDVPLTKLIDLIGEKDATAAYLDCRDAIFKLHNLCTSLGFRGFDFNKSLYFAAFRKDVALLKKEHDARKRIGLEVEWLEAQDVKDRFGFLAPGAILSKNAAYTDAYLLTHYLLQAGIKLGLRVYDRTFIRKTNFHQRSATLTTAEDVVIKARKVIFATGYEVTEQVARKIVNLHSTYVTISESMTSENPLREKDIMLWNTAAPYLYMRGTPDGRIIAGGRDEMFSSPVKRDELIAKKSRQLINDYTRLFPGMPFKPEFSWTGTFGSTRDGLPYIGTFGAVHHRYFALGFGGNGITFSIIAAEMIRDLLLGKKPEHRGLYSFDRV